MVFKEAPSNKGSKSVLGAAFRGGLSLVDVPGDFIVHHHTVYQTLGQQAGVLLSQLQSAQPAQVLALK